MISKIWKTCCTALAAWMLAPAAHAQLEYQRMSEDPEHVQVWNAFADSLYEVHRSRLNHRTVTTRSSWGGYGGPIDDPRFYREVEYMDAESGRLLSRIQWERRNPENVHVIELFFYDSDGRVRIDFLAAYLPRFRNAPIQTLINQHQYSGNLHGFRQFDASGNRIYERCRGEHLGERVDIAIDHPDLAGRAPLFTTEAYRACFSELAVELGKWADPRHVGSQTSASADEKRLRELNGAIVGEPGEARHYLARGRYHLEQQSLEDAIADFSHGLQLEPTMTEFYLLRGIALGRQRRIERGIADLDRYIKAHPGSSFALTKRGVRQLWLGDRDAARRDFERAIQVEPENAEAHDDLGVIHAQQGDLTRAAEHFRTALRIDPSYRKAHHNLAMVHHLSGRQDQALQAIDRAVRLQPDNRDSVLLKAEILAAKGMAAEARRWRALAPALQESNWSEQAAPASADAED